MDPAPFALYTHIPFCSAKCSYCDFNSYAGQDSLFGPYAEAVAREAAIWAPRLQGRRVESVFFGGGTPSLLPVSYMATIVGALKQHFDIDRTVEFSLEANPGTVDAVHLQGLRQIGFNRISFGVQSFHDDELRSLDRIHDGSEVEQAYAWARAAGFENVNLDLIYGLAGQHMAGWQENLEKAISMGPDHLSLYALTLEEGTPLTRDVGRGRIEGPDLDLQADMFEWSRERMARAGYHQYEISNWAREGRECRHNLVYWHNGDWLGLGAGAHSHLFDWRFADASSPSRYIALVNETALGHFVQPEAALTGDTTPLDALRQVTLREPPGLRREMSETVVLALRLREGLDITQWEHRFGVPFESVFAAAVQETTGLGLTELDGRRLRLKDEAVMLGDEAFMRFMPGWES